MLSEKKKESGKISQEITLQHYLKIIYFGIKVIDSSSSIQNN